MAGRCARVAMLLILAGGGSTTPEGVPRPGVRGGNGGGGINVKVGTWGDQIEQAFAERLAQASWQAPSSRNDRTPLVISMSNYVTH